MIRANTEPPEVRFHCDFVQQPQRARACGSGEKDRRPISPPVIVRVTRTDPVTGQRCMPEDLDDLFFWVMACDLWTEDGTQSATSIFQPASYFATNASPNSPSARQSPSRTSSSSSQADEPSGQEGPSSSREISPAGADSEGGRSVANLLGAMHVSPHVLKDQSGNPGVFFVFPDLSVRAEGVFRLRVRLHSLGLGGNRTNDSGPNLGEGYSEPFNSFSAKKFPGMLAPTLLSKHFAKQGIRIPARSNARRKAQDPVDAIDPIEEEGGDGDDAMEGGT